MSVSLSVHAQQSHATASPAPWINPADPQAGCELAGVVMHFLPDRQIYAQGDEARSFYKVVNGTVRTCQFLNDGRRQIDEFHMEGDVFGFEAGDDHRLSAEAVSSCTVIAYRRRGLEAMIAEDDRLARWFFAHVMLSLARAREHSLLLGRGSAAQKIASFLLEIARREASDNTADLAMSRQDIADYLGLTIETVSRTLSHFERDKVIALPTARRVRLKDSRGLRDIAA